MNENFIVAVDFDGTIVRHAFPSIGAPVPGAIDWLKRFQAEGMKLLLWTMRSDSEHMADLANDHLAPAVEYCRAQGIEFWGINENPQQRETQWSTSNKQYAHVYVDDNAAGTPLIYPVENPTRCEPLAYVDWSLVGPNVMARYAFWKGWERMRKEPHHGLTRDYIVGPDSPKVELPTPAMIQTQETS